MGIEPPNTSIIFISIEYGARENPFTIVSAISNLAAARAAEILCRSRMFISCTRIQTRRSYEFRLYIVGQRGMEAAQSAMGVPTDAAVAHVHFERERIRGNGNFEMHIFAVTSCCEGFGCRLHDCSYEEKTRDSEGKVFLLRMFVARIQVHGPFYIPASHGRPQLLTSITHCQIFFQFTVTQKKTKKEIASSEPTTRRKTFQDGLAQAPKPVCPRGSFTLLLCY
jgi:hypothetical protein